MMEPYLFSAKRIFVPDGFYQQWNILNFLIVSAVQSFYNRQQINLLRKADGRA